MIAALVYLVIYLIVLGLIVWLLTYLIDMIPLPDPFGRVARVCVLVIGVLIAILILLNFIGVDTPRLHP
jgi:hypothetical protein